MTATKRVAITQSNYLPWKGYFDVIDSVDEFVLYDEVQFTKRDWRNRNLIKTASGVQWITVPVVAKGRFTQRIDETRISDPTWGRAHWRTLHHAYARAPHFRMLAPRFEAYLEAPASNRLSAVNADLLRIVMEILDIDTPLRWSTEFASTVHASNGNRTGRLVAICTQAGATDYHTGPAARAYLDEAEFEQAGIRVHYVDYSGYREYPQLHGAFEHRVSVVDLIFNTGPAARRYLKPDRQHA